jgi:16S rRNA processing protein RimM
MAYSCNILLGHIAKVSRVEGAVTVKLEKSFIDNIPQMESVFLEIEGRPVPFFIAESEYSGKDTLRIWFIAYDSAGKLNEFTGCRVFLTSDAHSAEPDDDFGDITGYEVLTDDDLLLGHITKVIQNPGQYLLSISSPQNKEILVPLHEDLIIQLDHKMKLIILKIPEGLLEIN